MFLGLGAEVPTSKLEGVCHLEIVQQHAILYHTCMLRDELLDKHQQAVRQVGVGWLGVQGLQGLGFCVLGLRGAFPSGEQHLRLATHSLPRGWESINSRQSQTDVLRADELLDKHQQAVNQVGTESCRVLRFQVSESQASGIGA
jgi:hypothetical protein